MKFFSILSFLVLNILQQIYAIQFECEFGECRTPCNIGCSEREQCNDHYFEFLSNFCAREQLRDCHKCSLKANLKYLLDQQDYVVEIAKIFEISEQFSELPNNVFENATNAMIINIQNIGLTKIDSNTFKNLERLQKIDLSRNELTELPDRLFSGLYDLEELNFYGNKLKSVNENDFSDLTLLGKLDLSVNKITFVHENAFKNLTNLHILIIGNNEITKIFPLTFQNTLRIVKIDFFKNMIQQIYKKNFENLKNLEILRLSYNNIETVEDSSFKDLQSIEFFHLEFNQITSITQSTFDGVENVNHLYLNNNKLNKIASTAFSKMKKIEYLDLTSNACINRQPWGHAGSTGSYVNDHENTEITAEALEQFFANSECSKCVVPKIENGRIVGSLIGDVYETGSLFKQFQTAKVECDDGYSFLEVAGDDGLFTCNGDQFNKKFPECIKLCPKTEIIDYTTKSKCFYNDIEILCERDQAPGTEAEIVCDIGYKIPKTYVSPQTVKCLEGGEWDTKLIKCKPICGRLTAKAVPYVIGGVDAKITDTPWSAGIYQTNPHESEYFQICGGTILTKKIIISSSHCFFNEHEQKFNTKDIYKVTVGKYYRDFNAVESFATQNFSIAELRPVPGYKGYRGFYISDLALLILDGVIEFQPHVVPICLNTAVKFGVERIVRAGDFGMVAGWGYTKSDGDVSQTLKAISMPVIDFQQCFNEADDFKLFVTSDKFCGGFLNGSGVCSGDSGNGLVFPKTEDGQTVYYIRGVVSNTRQARQGGCDNFYTMFTNVLEYLPNIKNALEDYP